MPITTSMIEAGVKAAWKIGKTDVEKQNIDRAVLSTYRVKIYGEDKTLHQWIQDQVTDALDVITQGGYSATSNEVERIKDKIVSDALKTFGLR